MPASALLDRSAGKRNPKLTDGKFGKGEGGRGRVENRMGQMPKPLPGPPYRCMYPEVGCFVLSCIRWSKSGTMEADRAHIVAKKLTLNNYAKLHFPKQTPNPMHYMYFLNLPLNPTKGKLFLAQHIL